MFKVILNYNYTDKSGEPVCVVSEPWIINSEFEEWSIYEAESRATMAVLGREKFFPGDLMFVSTKAILLPTCPKCNGRKYLRVTMEGYNSCPHCQGKGYLTA